MKFAKNLSHALDKSADFALIELIADALGHMARNSPVSDVDYLESELNRSLDWLRASKSSVYRRFAACTMLQQLATNAPTIFFARINEFFDLIFGPMWDHKETIRQSACKALSACLAVLKERTYHLQWYCFIYDQLQEGFRSGSEESVHGSLIVIAEVLKYTGDFMIPRFKEVCKSIMQLKDHKSKIVRSAIISLLPSLANLCPDVFARAHMDESVEFLFKCAKHAELRPQALLSTGKLCLAVGPHLVSRIDEVMNILREAFSLSKKGGKGGDVVPEALLCVSDMVQGLGAPFHDRIYVLLEPMLQSGLTAELIDTLAVISSYMPSKKAQVQRRLLEEVTKILGGNNTPKVTEPDYIYSWGRKGERKPRVPFSFQTKALTASDSTSNAVAMTGILQPVPSLSTKMPSRNAVSMRLNTASPGIGSAATTPAKQIKPKKASFSLFSKSTSGSASKATTAGGASVGAAAIGLGLGLGSEMDPPNVQMNDIVLLSLKTLASLSIPYHSLLFTVQQSVLPYLASDDYLVRKEAAITCAKMVGSIVERSIVVQGHTALAVEDIINRLLEVAVSDTSVKVRLGVLKALTSDFDKYLARSHHVETIMLLLADEMFDIKLETLTILGRLAPKNAAAILPPLRTHLNRLMSELTNCPDYRMIEEAATMLCNFMKFTKFHFLVRPIMQTLLECLPLKGKDVRATTSALETVGELSVVLQQELTPYAETLLPVIITNMFDASSLKKQEVAVRTLGQFSKSTGLAVRPYLLYPQLLPKTLDLLCRNSVHKPLSLRLEILRTLGLLGALEPSRYAAIVSFIQTYYKSKKPNSDGAEDIKPKVALHLASPMPMAGSSVGEHLRSGLHETTTKDKDPNRDRAESNMSFHDKILASGRAEMVDIARNVDRRSSSNGLEADELLMSDKLLQGDNADAPAYLFMYEQSVMRAISDPPHEKMILNKHTPGSPDFYPRVALSALLKILQDPALSVHHSTATQTIIQVFGGLGVRSIPFLEQIVPYFLQIVRRSATGLRESILQQLSQLVAIIGHYITPYLPAILDILKEYWSEHLEHVLAIVQQVAITASDTFSSYLPTLLPLLLSSLSLPPDVTFMSFRSDHLVLKPLEDILSSIKVLRVALRPHIHLFVPPLCKLMSELQELGQQTIPIQTSTVQTIRYLVTRSRGAVVEQSNVILSSLVHMICRSIIKYNGYNQSANSEVYIECVATLTVLAQQCGPRILKFDSLILRATDGRGIDMTTYKEVSMLIRAGLWDEMSYADLEEGSPIVGRHKELAEESTLVSIMSSSNFMNDDIDDRLNLAFYNTNNNAYSGVPKLLLNQQQLARSWDVSQRSTANDWHEWLWRFNVDLLRESPSPTLRACAPLAQAYPPIARELFHAAFVSCWHELSDPYQESLVRALQTAFKSSTIPSDILQHLLNLAEFMEHDVEALPISLSILAELAQKGQAYAKALHYRELEYQTNPAGCFENLININKKLDQYEAASGLLKVATQIQKKYPELKEFYTVQESWLAKLGYWDEALQKYDEKLLINPKDSVAIAGRMKCLESLGKWEEVLKICEENLDNLRFESEANKTNKHTKAAVIGARAAWSLNEWLVMDSCVSQLPPDNVDGSFLKAVLAVHTENFAESRRLLEQTRRHLDTSISSLMTESYGRAYMPLIMAQQCSELEEITEYKLFLQECNATENSTAVAPSSMSQSDSWKRIDGPQGNSELQHLLGPPRRFYYHSSLSQHLSVIDQDNAQSTSANSTAQGQQQEAIRRKTLLSEKWRRRIRGCASSGRAAIPYWKYLLNGRRMVLTEQEDLDTWLDFVSLCRNGGNLTLADRILNMCKTSVDTFIASQKRGRDGMLDDDCALMDRRIKFALLKQQWSVGNRAVALQGLEELVRGIRSSPTASHDASYLSCLLKLGEWKVAILDPGQVVDISTRADVLALYSKSTVVDPNSYRAWHQWGLSNYRAIEESKATAKQNNVKSPKLLGSSKEQLVIHTVNAINGFMRSLVLGTRRFSSFVTQDMLCILSLWFAYGKMPEVHTALHAGLAMVPLDNWLGVLPQLIARIDHPDSETRALLHSLLVRIGMKHAQALVYPLSVALKSPKGERKEAAESLMTSLRQHSNKLIDQALLVSQELVRVAILWEEKWHWALEEASRQYFGDGNIQAMLNTLLPLHEAVEAGPMTMREAAFIETYKHEIYQAAECLSTYKRVIEEKGLIIPTQKSTQSQPESIHIAQAWDFYYAMFKKINTQLPHINSLDLQTCSPALFEAHDLDLGVPGTYTVSTNAIRIKSFSPVVQIIRSKQRPR
ncbi:DUF3385 domain-containing protein [archaeon]|nr:MAG: DUF3385 domain-containing protein [archaeon]